MTQLTEALADRLAQRLLRMLPAGSASVRLAELEALGWPVPVLAFLRQAFVEALEEARAHLANPWFDFDDPAVQGASAAFWRAVYRTARLPMDHRADLIQKAARAIIWHLLEPVSALVDFAFPHGSGAQELDRVLFRMRYFAAYPYLLELFEVYARQRGWTHPERDEVARALRRLDRLFCEDLDPKGWRELLSPWFACFPEGVPGEALSSYFARKERPQEAARFSSWARIRSPEELEAALRVSHTPEETSASLPRVWAPDLSATFASERSAGPPDSEPLASSESTQAEAEDLAPREHFYERLRLWEAEALSAAQESLGGTANEASSEGEPGTSPASPERPLVEPPEEDTSAAPRRSDVHEEPAGPTPLWKVFLSRRSEPSRRIQGRSDPLWRRFRTDPGDREPELVLSPEQRSRFVREIFRGQEGALEALLHSVRQFADWKACSRFLDEQLFELYDVDPYAPATVELIDLLQDWFVRRGRA
ncbi:MAG: hypothetical protein N2561_07240 [Bacteroidetes bacterium]|nr:hypothetical protein [Rhodothermia bacterium]MCS7155030.1 hypothetical protein [Bacteroidota bacterium]MCX7907314.1 hypothetical protein [Bacteroidota bacterium]MDW8137959.1 hypothetical protein [Bacteroidota bacterium]MDW8286189.1 hypothetical protein [Bacteroidota bacterium]